jgi:hypothetical protein
VASIAGPGDSAGSADPRLRLVVLSRVLPVEHHRHLAGAPFARPEAVEIHPMVVNRARGLDVANLESARQQPQRELRVLERGVPERGFEADDGIGGADEEVALQRDVACIEEAVIERGSRGISV